MMRRRGGGQSRTLCQTRGSHCGTSLEGRRRCGPPPVREGAQAELDNTDKIAVLSVFVLAVMEISCWYLESLESSLSRRLGAGASAMVDCARVRTRLFDVWMMVLRGVRWMVTEAGEIYKEVLVMSRDEFVLSSCCN